MVIRQRASGRTRVKRPSAGRRCCALLLLSLALASACAGPAPSPTPTSSQPWIEEEVSFTFGPNELYGVLTLPTGEGPCPAIVIVSGSVSTNTGVRAGASSAYHIDHARKMVLSGFAVLRYDPPGVGQSSGQAGFETLDLRTEEVAAALRYVQSRSDIRAQHVGLHANSQGAWVIAMAAARYPDEVAFIIPVSSSGVSVAEQQVYSIEAQSKAAYFAEDDVTTAVLFGRLLIDWQLVQPIYRDVNEADAQALGGGPWTDFLALVYEPGEITPAEALQQGLDILISIQDEPWAKYLYLQELYFPQLEGIPPDQVEALRAMVGPNLLNDPREYLTKVQCPVLAFFGENDLLQPTTKSAALYEQYLGEAGNRDYQIVVIPDEGHSIGIWTPGYWEALSAWLERLSSE